VSIEIDLDILSRSALSGDMCWCGKAALEQREHGRKANQNARASHVKFRFGLKNAGIGMGLRSGYVGVGVRQA